MKTTLNIDDRLLTEAKATAALEQTSLTRLIEEGIMLRLRSAKAKPRRSRIALPIFAGADGLRPGIDPSSNRSMFDAADE